MTRAKSERILASVQQLTEGEAAAYRDIIAALGDGQVVRLTDADGADVGFALPAALYASMRGVFDGFSAVLAQLDSHGAASMAIQDAGGRCVAVLSTAPAGGSR